MYVHLRTSGIRLPRGRAHFLLQRVRAAFTGLADGVAGIVVRVAPAGIGGGGSTARDCEIEVHLADGSVEVVRERRRRLGTVIGRALLRAWHLARSRLGAAATEGTVQRLHAPLHARLLPLRRHKAGLQ